MNRDSQSKMSFLSTAKPTRKAKGVRMEWDLSLYYRNGEKTGTYYISLSAKFLEGKDLPVMMGSDDRRYLDMAISVEGMAVVFNPYSAGLPEDQALEFVEDKVNGTSYRHYSKKFSEIIAERILLPDDERSAKFKLVRNGSYGGSPRFQMELINRSLNSSLEDILKSK